MPSVNLENWDNNVHNYLKSIKTNMELGNYTEHTHRPALKMFLEAICPKIVATNEPRRIECGAPDFIITHGQSPWGYIEAKDIWTQLDETQESEQIERYRNSLSNLILTNYLEFRWFLNGVLREPVVCIASVTNDNKIEVSNEGLIELKNILLDFLNTNVRTVKDSKELASRLANLAKTLQTSIASAYAAEDEDKDEELHSHLSSIRDILVPDLTPAQFADMYAQTITYGLFAARCYCTNAEEFTREKAAYFLPKTNPFLRKLFTQIAGPDLNIRYAWIVDDIVDLLARSDMESILKDFGKSSGKEDPVVHFYETFLSVYDPTLREKRGIYYTPTPVVEYIVKSVDDVLKKDFARPDGLADPTTLVLDPACGTGTFLYFLIKLTHDRLAGQEGLWKDYVANLLERLFGFEILMTPYAIAHLKLSLELQDLGYTFNKEQRLGVYLTNSLEEGLKKSEVIFAKWLSDEANAAAAVKREKPILVVFGNPPYSGHSSNKGTWIRNLIHDYRLIDGKDIEEKNIKWLQDDYVKFIRFGQWRIEQTGQGIVAFITNHAYLDNPTFRAMRKNLIDHFTDIYVLNLNGNKNRRTTAPDGRKDENVFDIRQGVAIVILEKCPEHKSPATVSYAELWGDRDSKYSYLKTNTVLSTEWTKLQPETPDYYFVPVDRTMDSEFNQGYSLPEIFPRNNVGFVTSRDNLVIDTNLGRLEERISQLLDSSIDDEELKQKYNIQDTKDWHLSDARKKLRSDSSWKTRFAKCLYRPFDERYIFFSKDLLERTRPDISDPLLAKGNFALVSMRQVAQDDVPYSYSTVTQYPVDNRCFRSNKGIVQVFPLFVYNAKKDLVPNIGTTFREQFCKAINRNWSEKPDAEKIDPFSILCYVVATMFSNNYRTKYSELLRRNYPKIPITANYECFTKLKSLGNQLVDALTLNTGAISLLITKFPVEGPNIVESRFPIYEKDTQRVFINKTQYFEGISDSIWEYQLGGRQVCWEWLKERRGEHLSYDEMMFYQRMIVCIARLIELSEKIDQTLDEYGGAVIPRSVSTESTLSDFVD
ncbi:MAG: N-6 DNA methylase [Thaumarchaeota archaeon]|nr:N-6 DNA methylase [Nitrososphaerota archaeon]MCL5317233.1 N-6 DNA methylase [Nitrososphaerota archaeon]